jgi:hypothetical protein
MWATVKAASSLISAAWQKRKIPFAELADDPRLCYAYITAHAVQG